MKICVEKSRSPKGKLGVANPAAKRRRPLADLDTNVILAFKHGMQLRSSSGSVSPTKSAVKEKPSPPPPVIVRPDSPVDALSCETLVLRPKLKSSPTKDSPPPAVNAQPSELKQDERWLEITQRWTAEQERIKARRKYVKERLIPRSGFTAWESSLCSHYMWKREFEDEDPIPSERKYFKAVLDQVRATRGYGVTLRIGGINTGFTPLMGDLENDPKLRELVDEMIKIVLGAMKRRLRKKYTSRGVENLVSSSQNYFLTLGVSDPTGTHQIVEALFLKSHMGCPKKFQRFEWKIKQGSEVIFTTAEIQK